jgi:hypothetical protein
MKAIDRDYFNKRKAELAEQGIVLDCPSLENFGPRPHAMGVYKGGLNVWFTEPVDDGYWHLHVAIRGFMFPRDQWPIENNRIAEYDNGRGMRLLRPETLEEAIDTAVEILTNPAVARKHRDYYIEKRLKPAIESTQATLDRLTKHLATIESVEITDDILNAKQPEIQRRIPGMVFTE